MTVIESSFVSLPLNQLIGRAQRHLEELGYSTRTRRYYACVWRALASFVVHSRTSPRLTRRLATAFLRSRGVPLRDKTTRLTWCQKEARRAIRVLLDLKDTGQFRRHPKRKKDPSFPEAFRQELDRFEVFCRQHLHHSLSTRLVRRRTLILFAAFLGSRGVRTPRALRSESLSSFIETRARDISRRSLATEVGHLRSFVRFLSMRELVSPKLTAHARALRFAKERRLPPVWPVGAAEALLAAAKRSSSQGKRDYAILLLACRLGLRAVDIRTLRLDDICWSEARIQLIQHKTGAPLSLPLTQEVGQALVDYLRKARPKVDHREVFLKVRAPNEPLGRGNPLYSVMASALRRAQLELPAGLPRGLHGLRHTLATRLVCAGESLESVAGILGHRSVESTRVYTHLDVEALRCVALDPEEVLNG